MNLAQPGRNRVARSCTLLYRGFAIRRASVTQQRFASVNPWPNEIRRYGRLEICATTGMPLQGKFAQVAKSFQRSSAERRGRNQIRLSMEPQRRDKRREAGIFFLCVRRVSAVESSTENLRGLRKLLWVVPIDTDKMPSSDLCPS